MAALAAAIVFTAGCDRRDAFPSPKTHPQSNPPFSLIDNLNGKRADMLNKDGLDPAAPGRIDMILSTINHGNAKSLRQTPAIFTATMFTAVDVPGADGFTVLAAGPVAQVQRIELLDASGAVLATTDTFINNMSTDESLGLAQVDCLTYIIPSTWNPRPVDQATENVQFKNEGKARPLILTHDQVTHPLFARLVYAGGLVSDTVPVFHEPSLPPLTVHLETIRASETSPYNVTGDAAATSSIVKRIDAALAAIRDDARSPSAHPRLLSATANDQPDFSPGTSLLELRVVGPSDVRPRVEILDEHGGVIAAYEGRTDTYYQAVDAEARTALLSVNITVIPSLHDPLPNEKIVDAARKARMKNFGIDNVADLADLVELPSDWPKRPLTARIVFGNGATTNAVPIVDSPPTAW